MVRNLRDEAVPALKHLAPDSGTYMNKADPTNPDWRDDYFGEHYPGLSELKLKWDPHGIFGCKPRVDN